MVLGFNIGEEADFSLEEGIKFFGKIGCNALELVLGSAENDERWVKFENLSRELISGFEHFSLHAPAFAYGDSKESISVLDRLQKLYDKFNFKLAVIHPDLVENWSIFKKYQFPIAVENMDNRKKLGRTVESMKEVFSKVDAPMVLDVNHCYVNDPTLNLVREMHETFKDRIKEIHLSGFETLHDPLFKTKQVEIIKSIPDKNIPIIIESPVFTFEEIEAEYNYIKEHLND